MQTIPCCFIMYNNNEHIYVALCCCLGAFVDSIYVRLRYTNTLIIYNMLSLRNDNSRIYYVVV